MAKQNPPFTIKPPAKFELQNFHPKNRLIIADSYYTPSWYLPTILKHSPGISSAFHCAYPALIRFKPQFDRTGSTERVSVRDGFKQFGHIYEESSRPSSELLAIRHLLGMEIYHLSQTPLPEASVRLVYQLFDEFLFWIPFETRKLFYGDHYSFCFKIW